MVFAYNGGIGDRLCNLPALRALAALFAGRLTLVCGRGDGELYYSDLNLRAIHELDFEFTGEGFAFDARALARQVAFCDLLLSINPWQTASVSELLAYLPGVESVGFFPEFGHGIACDYEGHAMDMAFAVPHFLDNSLKLVDFSQPPVISEEASAVARDFRRSYSGWGRVLFMHTDTKPEKSWPIDRFEQLLDIFLDEFPEVGVLVVDVYGEKRSWARRFTNRLLPVALPLDACFALLRDADLFLGIDSCHLHAADLFRVPGVGLFGPTTCRRWGFKFSNHRHVQGPGRMDAIEVGEVYDALCNLARFDPIRAERETRFNNSAVCSPIDFGPGANCRRQ